MTLNPDILLLNLIVLVVHWFCSLMQLILVPLCFVLSWLVVIMVCWNLWSACRQGLAQARRMHQIPCANCQFFTGNYYLKCTVRPDIALSEAAIDCSDYAVTNTTIYGISSISR